MPTRLTFHCCIRNYHELSGFKQHTLIISWCLWVRSLLRRGWALCSGSHQALVMMWPGLQSHLRLGIFLQAHVVVGIIHLLMVMGVRAQFLNSSQPRGAQLLAATHFSLPCDLLTMEQHHPLKPVGSLFLHSELRQSLMLYRTVELTSSFVPVSVSVNNQCCCGCTGPCGSYYDCRVHSAITVRELWEKKKTKTEAHYLQDLEMTWHTWGHTVRLQQMGRGWLGARRSKGREKKTSDPKSQLSESTKISKTKEGAVA